MMIQRLAWAFVIVCACGPDSRRDEPAQPDAAGPDIDAPPVPNCPPPAMPAGPSVALAAPFDTLYSVYDLGPVPGVPNPLGGTVISSASNDTLLVAGGSENSTGAIYKIGVARNECGHITSFVGTATTVAATPYVDANLVYARDDLLLYTEWPMYNFSQLAGGPGGLGRVPPNLASAGELRMVTWPGGRWFHAATTPDGNLLAVGGVTQTATLPNEPGGFAYVPAGSPGFAAQSLIVAEWRFDANMDRVAVYEVDAMGDPVVATRREFFAKFPRPWGAYFEPVTGDYLFLSWGSGEDHVYIVQGFVPPPPIF
jgi:hypothetical protein